MRTAGKSFVSKVLVLLLFFALILSATVALPMRGGAEEPSQPDLSQSFYMEEGAGVRIAEEESGIRFTAVLSKTYYDSLVAENANAQIRIYTVINRAENPVENQARVFEHNKTADGKYVAPVFDTETGLAELRAAIVYDNVPEESFAAASALRLKAQTYIDIIRDSKETIAAMANGNERSMRVVANAALLSGKYTDPAEIEVLKTYLGNSVLRENEEAYLEVEGTNEFVLPDGATYNEAYIGTKKVEASFEGGKVTIQNASSYDLKLGESEILSVFDAENNVYSVPVQYVTKAIRTAEDLSYFSYVQGEDTEWSGYYVLAENIDATGYTHKHELVNGYQSKANSKGGLSGTFDGKGHTISNITFSWGGMFQNIAQGGVLKNTAFVGVKFTANTEAACAIASNIAGPAYGQPAATMSNIYLQADEMPSGTDAALVTSWGMGLYARMSYCVIECAEDVETSNAFMARQINTQGNLNNQTGIRHDVYFITPTPLVQIASGATTPDEKKADAENRYQESGLTLYFPLMYRYDTLEDWLDAEHDYSGFDQKCWDLTSGVPVWRNLSA